MAASTICIRSCCLTTRGRISAKRVVNVAIAPLVSREMQQIGRLVIFDDITERAELERRLVQADKLSSIGLLAAGVAHEVNTPLAVISTYAQMLAKQVAGDEQKSRMLEKIAKQTFRASEIVNSLLNFSRTSSTEVAAGQPESRDSGNAFAAGASAANRGHSRPKRICDSSLAPIERKFRQAAAGVSESVHQRSRRHGAGRSAAKCRPSNEGPVVRVDVADTGHGIAPEHLHAHLRSVLHHQSRAQRHRPGLSRHLRHHAGTWRQNRSVPEPGRRLAVPDRAPASEKRAADRPRSRLRAR